MCDIHKNIVDEVSEGIQGVSWTISKEYITIKRAIKSAITWTHKAWVKLMQLGTSVQLALPEAMLLTTRMFQNQRWNLVSVNILVAHEYRNSWYNTYLYT